MFVLFDVNTKHIRNIIKMFFLSALMNNYVKRVICGRKSNKVVREIVTCNG